MMPAMVSVWSGIGMPVLKVDVMARLISKFAILLFSGLMILYLPGCGCYEPQPMPQIVYDYSQSAPESASVISRPAVIQRHTHSQWVPPSSIERQWTAIVIHHSATSFGNAEIFDQWHRENNHWDGVGYDFVIGNGVDSPDGAVEVTFRWRQQRTGAHCGGTKDNWANEQAIGICLVGNFNETLPSDRQIESLVRLLRFLQDRYRIASSRIYGHGQVPGVRYTECPGRRFPMAHIKSMLDF